VLLRVSCGERGERFERRIHIFSSYPKMIGDMKYVNAKYVKCEICKM
jgi:hypothetical protein